MAKKFLKSFLKEQTRRAKQQKRMNLRQETLAWSSQNKKPTKRAHIAR